MLILKFLLRLKEHIKINILLLDNSGYQCIKNLQMAHGSEGFGNEFRFREESTGRLTGDFMPVDFKKYAEALGVKAFFAETLIHSNSLERLEVRRFHINRNQSATRNHVRRISQLVASGNT